MSEARSWNFVVEGMTCSGCMRRIRNMTDQEFNVQQISFDLGHQTVTVKTDQDFDRDRFVGRVNDMGFAARLAEDLKPTSQHRPFLMRLGVAAAAAGNIMLISVALYAGAEASPVAGVLKGFIGLLFLPILFFSAIPFYQNCVMALQARRASVDIPIVLALWGGGIAGYYNLLTGSEHFYFDSLSVLVFLILASRYLVIRIQQSHLQPLSIEDIFGKAQYTVSRGNSTLDIERESIQPGDEVLLSGGDYLPVDGQWTGGDVEIDTSFLTGESRPVLVRCHQHVYAGSRLISAKGKFRVSHALAESRVHRLVEELNQSLQAKTELTSMTDRWAQWFTYGVLGVGAIFFALTFHLPQWDAFNRVLALLVISCPCVLAIVTPLSISLAVKKALGQGLLVKRPDVFERIVQLKNFVLDKTGTLTTGKFELVDFTPLRPSLEQQKIACALEQKSHHPYAQALIQHFAQRDLPKVDGWQEIAGVGVQGHVGGQFYEIKRAGEDSLGFFRQGELLWSAKVHSAVKPEAVQTVQEISKRMDQVYLLSGDHVQPTMEMGAQLNLPKNQVIAGASPEQKAELVESLNQVGYVGDGINDCLAMSKSDLSFSVGGSAEATFRSSDVHLVTNNLNAVAQLIETSHQVLSTIKTNMWISLIYNTVFGSAALLGFINPLVAAVLMPISSISVVSLTLWRLGPSRAKEQG